MLHRAQAADTHLNVAFMVELLQKSHYGGKTRRREVLEPRNTTEHYRYLSNFSNCPCLTQPSFPSPLFELSQSLS